MSQLGVDEPGSLGAVIKWFKSKHQAISSDNTIFPHFLVFKLVLTVFPTSPQPISPNLNIDYARITGQYGYNLTLMWNLFNQFGACVVSQNQFGKIVTLNFRHDHQADAGVIRPVGGCYGQVEYPLHIYLNLIQKFP